MEACRFPGYAASGKFLFYQATDDRRQKNAVNHGFPKGAEGSDSRVDVKRIDIAGDSGEPVDFRLRDRSFNFQMQHNERSSNQMILE